MKVFTSVYCIFYILLMLNVSNESEQHAAALSFSDWCSVSGLITFFLFSKHFILEPSPLQRFAFQTENKCDLSNQRKGHTQLQILPSDPTVTSNDWKQQTPPHSLSLSFTHGGQKLKLW